MPKLVEPKIPSDICCRCGKSWTWVDNPKSKKANLCFWCFNAPPKQVIYPENELTYNGKKVKDIKGEKPSPIETPNAKTKPKYQFKVNRPK